ncbi:hypothetical protein [Haloglomus salinum]|uniref:hypothetical protein n=1 Tax=Haloglomus salinum TaxID=2962673 RepID=UPI0020C96511|nr:hypothetical protein [Haloglomus salinum]
MDIDELDRVLADAFDAAAGERRAVARMASDLAAAGHYGDVAGHDLTPELVVANLEDAPDEELASKWNWWLGSLEIAFGRSEDLEHGFAEFQVRQYEGDGEDDGATGGAEDDTTGDGN